MIRITLDDREVQAALARLQQRVSDMRPVMADIGELLVERAKERFATSTGPDGKRWEPNAPATILGYLRQYGGSYRKDGSLSKRGQARAAAKKPLIGETKQLMGTRLLAWTKRGMRNASLPNSAPGRTRFISSSM